MSFLSQAAESQRASATPFAFEALLRTEGQPEISRCKCRNLSLSDQPTVMKYGITQSHEIEQCRD